VPPAKRSGPTPVARKPAGKGRPKAPPPGEPAPEATRDQILTHAARLFRHHGYAATTLREIADAAGIKAGSIYYHFGSKDDILGEVLDAGIDAVMSAVRERIAALPVRKIGRPSDVANAVVFFASPVAAGHVTGQVLSVSGGYSMVG
jgi:AcrR family transcriptional regulator